MKLHPKIQPARFLVPQTRGPMRVSPNNYFVTPNHLPQFHLDRMAIVSDKGVTQKTAPTQLGRLGDNCHVVTATKCFKKKFPETPYAVEGSFSQGVCYLSRKVNPASMQFKWLASWRELKIPADVLRYQNPDWQEVLQTAILALLVSGDTLNSRQFASTNLNEDQPAAASLIPDFATNFLEGRFFQHGNTQFSDDPEEFMEAVFSKSRHQFSAIWKGRDAAGFFTAVRAHMSATQVVNPTHTLDIGYLSENPNMHADWPEAELHTLQTFLFNDN